MLGLTHKIRNGRGPLVKALLALTVAGTIVLAGAGTAAASASRAYNPYKEITIGAACETYFDPYWQPFHRMVAVSTPTMYSTTGRTYRVSWQPLLYKWSNGWTLDQIGPVIYGIASLGTSLPSFDGFAAQAGNRYAVRIGFRWYRNGVRFRSRFYWVTNHSEIAYQYDANGGVHIGTKTVGEPSCYMN
jgi:hypothetical protein